MCLHNYTEIAFYGISYFIGFKLKFHVSCYIAINKRVVLGITDELENESFTGEQIHTEPPVLHLRFSGSANYPERLAKFSSRYWRGLLWKSLQRYENTLPGTCPHYYVFIENFIYNAYRKANRLAHYLYIAVFSLKIFEISVS